MKQELDIASRDLIPLLDIDFVIAEAKRLYERRGPLLYMTNPWWENTNRHVLIHHLTKTYQHCLKNKLSYKDSVRFSIRTVYHMFPTARVVVREASQSIGSVTLRAHFKNVHMQLGQPKWSEIFALEDRFWEVQMRLKELDSYGAILRVGSKRSYILWETIHSIVVIAEQRKVPAIDLFDFIISGSKYLNPSRLGAIVGFGIAKSNAHIQSQLPRIRAQPAFASSQLVEKKDSGPDWKAVLQLGQARLTSGTIPLGFYIAKEHLGQGGSMEDVVEVSPNGQYRTKKGDTFFGDFWFKNARNPWLIVQVGEHNVNKVSLDSWYDPSQYGALPTVEQLSSIDPLGPWTKVWDKLTGAPISAQAGRISLKLR